MTKINPDFEEKEKILKGLDMVYEKLLAFKKGKNSELVVWRNNQIVRIKPDDIK
ncbi:MAG: hypothetical protein QM528_08900 [Phycisphaerales bacterium]|nr:hypothetical protein [Phycisphaerales bacterium]